MKENYDFFQKVSTWKSHISRHLQGKTSASHFSPILFILLCLPSFHSHFHLSILFSVFSDPILQLVSELQKMRKIITSYKSWFTENPSSGTCFSDCNTSLFLLFILKAQKMYWCHKFLPKAKLPYNVSVNCISILALLSKKNELGQDKRIIKHYCSWRWLDPLVPSQSDITIILKHIFR